MNCTVLNLLSCNVWFVGKYGIALIMNSDSYVSHDDW